MDEYEFIFDVKKIGIVTGNESGKSVFEKADRIYIDGVEFVRERTCTNVSEDKRTFECSACGYYHPDLQDFKHCPECGAKVVE